MKVSQMNQTCGVIHTEMLAVCLIYSIIPTRLAIGSFQLFVSSKVKSLFIKMVLCKALVLQIAMSMILGGQEILQSLQLGGT